jgi:hypothetical protein
MNKLDVSLFGGHPLTLADFNFIQEAWRDSFRAAANILRDPASSGLAPSFVIAGCERTNPSAGVWAIAEGYVAIEGEICYVPAHNVGYSDINDPLFWYVEQTAVAPSPVEYRDFSLQNVHLQRVAKVRTTSSSVPFATMPTVRAMLDRRQRGRTGTFTLINGWTGIIEYTVVAGRLQLYGYVQASSNIINAAVMCQVPAELTPKVFGLGYVGTMPVLTSGEFAALAVGLSLSGGGLPFNSTRLFLNGTTITSTVQYPVMAELTNLTSAPPRTCNLRVMQPQAIPGGSDSVVYNLNGITWDITAE